MEVRASGESIGFTGLDEVGDRMPFTGVEVGMAAGPLCVGVRLPSTTPENDPVPTNPPVARGSILGRRHGVSFHPASIMRSRPLIGITARFAACADAFG